MTPPEHPGVTWEKTAASQPSVQEARPVPTAPTKLGRQGRKLWRTMTEVFDFTRDELITLEAACRQRDDITALEDLIRTQGVTVIGSTGQVRLNPALTEVRLARKSLVSLVGELRLPAEDENDQAAGGASIAMNARSRQAQKAANRRWANFREFRDGGIGGMSG